MEVERRMRQCYERVWGWLGYIRDVWRVGTPEWLFLYLLKSFLCLFVLPFPIKEKF